MKKEWFDIPGYEGRYQITKNGEVKSLNYMRTGKEEIVKQGTDGKGHLYVTLTKEGLPKNSFIHTLMYKTFVGDIPRGFHIHHIDENPANNTLDNFELISAAEHNKIHKSKPVMQFDLNGNFIKEWKSASEVQRSLNYKQTYISGCCLGKYNTAYNFIWKFKNSIKIN